MTDQVHDFATALDGQVRLQEELLRVIARLRGALIEGDAEDLAAATREAEVRLHALNMAERTRERAAAELARELGVESTRWNDLREELDDHELDVIEPRVEALENVVRRLELSNAVSGRMIRHEIDQVDFAIRLAGASESPTYSAQGSGSTSSDPLMLNTSA
jgi:flagellar biosynthesis/type III secretory pathway chaperone